LPNAKARLQEFEVDEQGGETLVGCAEKGQIESSKKENSLPDPSSRKNERMFDENRYVTKVEVKVKV
jgi:hypothetical protein